MISATKLILPTLALAIISVQSVQIPRLAAVRSGSAVSSSLQPASVFTSWLEKGCFTIKDYKVLNPVANNLGKVSSLEEC
jgi:hypothetical protein